MSTILKNLIQLIKNETLPSANTANRVGTTLEYIDTEKADRENTYTKSEVMDLVNEIKLLASSDAKFIGSISPTTPINPDGNIWAFAEAGTYPNSGGLVVNPNTLTILSRAGGVWSKSEVEMPSNELDKDGGALSYSLAQAFLGGFMEQDDTTPIATVDIPKSATVFGGHFLYNNNTYNAIGQYPEIGVIHNFPVGDATKLKVENFYGINQAQFAAIVAQRANGSTQVLLPSTASNVTAPQTYDVSEFEFVSFQIADSSPFPTLQLIQYATVGTDVREWIEDKLKVLNFFLNPYETVYQDLAMPRPGEIHGAIINKQWQQYASGNTNNGAIQIADIPSEFDTLEITGNFSVGGGGTLWLGGCNDGTGVYEQLLAGVAGAGTKKFKIDRDKYTYYVYSRYDNNHTYKLSKSVSLPITIDSVKDYIDNHVSSGSAISNETRAQIARPTKLLRIEFTTSDPLPTVKDVVASGQVLITDMQGLGIKKFATIKVQGASSAIYPKKNWTLVLFNDEAKTSEFKLRVGNWAEHSEFVFKSNWIDATHARNLISNHIWEDIVQSRAGYPKRENEIAYAQSYTGTAGRFDSGALTHVDGVPAEIYINGGFYGIGSFNLGKKRENYDLKSSTQNHIQLAAETHVDFYAYQPEQWEVRNPKTPDANFNAKIGAWFASNALTGQAFKDAFTTNHDLRNAVDFYLLAEFIQSPDMYTKNLILTSWDGVKFYFLPYDMDTTFGLQWDGQALDGWTGSIRTASFWNKFYNAYSAEIKARYAELKGKGVLTFDNMYKHADRINKTIGVKMYEKEFEAWASVPSNSTIYTGFPQLYDWMKNRIIWLDSQYS